MGIRSAGNRTSAGTYFSCELAGLAALRRMMHEHDRAVLPVRNGIDGVVDRRHVAVIVLVAARRQGTIQGVDGYALVRAGRKRCDSSLDAMDILQLSAKRHNVQHFRP